MRTCFDFFFEILSTPHISTAWCAQRTLREYHKNKNIYCKTYANDENIIGTGM